MDYAAFLKAKELAIKPAGFKPLFLPDSLFDFQRHLVDWSVRLGRAAIFADCGLGKSLMQLTWAENVVRKTKGRVLILAPLAVSRQTVTEGEKFGIKVTRSAKGELHKGIVVTNYERLQYFDPKDFAAVVCDESSILKNSDGKYRKQITQFMAKVPYRLLCSATPAPNDFMELGTSSEALGVMGRNQMLGMFFTNGGESTQQWRLKGHAKRRFWQWMAGWARAVRRPSDIGFPDGKFILPPLNTYRHYVPTKRESYNLTPYVAVTLADQKQERRETLRERCELVASLVPKNRPALVWCHLNDEGDLLEELIPDAMQVSGSDSDEDKEERLVGFSKGDFRVLVTKPKIAGFGLNWQHCSDVFYFPSHCYDERTEVLTKRGWLSFADVLLTDEVATANKDSQQFEWQHPTDVIWSPYEGDMIRFCNGEQARSFDLLVTPNHRMYVKRCGIRYKKDSDKWLFRRAGTLQRTFKKQEYRMLSVPKVSAGNSPDFVDIPSPDRVYSKTKLIGKIPIRQFMELAGWYISEGHCTIRGTADSPSGDVVITQSEKNATHRKDIIKLLKSLPVEGGLVNHKTHNIRICCKQLAVYLVDQFGHGATNKRIPRWVKELDPSLLVILRDTILKGDGCSSEGKKRFLRTTSRQLADDFMEVCIKTGIRASSRFRDYEQVMTDAKKALGFVNPGGPYYDVNIAWEHGEPSIHVRPERVRYSGMIGCVTVPNGTVVVRRNGIPVVSGNSHEQYYQAIRRCWRFGQQNPVNCVVVASEAEKLVLDNMLRKERQSIEMYDGVVRNMIAALKGDGVNGQEEMELPTWLVK